VLLGRPRFEHRQSGGGDFRIAVIGNQFFVRSIRLVQE
jgi:hypothetical protein